MAEISYLDLEGLEYFKGKQDAANDAEFAKASAVPTKVSQLQNDSGFQTASQLQSAISSALASVLTWRGVKASVGELPTSDQKVGDVWHVSADSAEYAWDGSEWQALGGVLQASVSWSDIIGKPSAFEPAEHDHEIADVTGLQSALEGKAASGHTHTTAQVTGLDSALAGKAASTHTHAVATSGAAGFLRQLDGSTSHYLRGDGTWGTPPNTTYSEATSSADGLMSAEDKSKLDGIAAGANNYTHPSSSAGAKASGLYKIATDAQGHVTGATAVAKSDITGLGIPAQDTTYQPATQAAAGLMSAADKAKLDGISTISTTEIDALFA